MPKAAIISLKVAAFFAALVPFGLLVYGGFTNNLGPDPIATLTHTTGDWTIRFLLITLAITPVRRLSAHLNWLVRFRRMMGLYAFFYGTMHLLTYVWLYSQFDVHRMIADILKRRFITMGMLGWLLMLPLALTSTVVGHPQNWAAGNGRVLHRLVYFAAIAGVIHYWWLVKNGVYTPLTYTVILAALLLARIVWSFAKARKQPAQVSTRNLVANSYMIWCAPSEGSHTITSGVIAVTAL